MKGGVMNQQILRIHETCALLGLSRATLYRMMDKDAFPRPVSLSDRTVGWPARVVEAWLANRSSEASGAAGVVESESADRVGLWRPQVLELKPCIDVVRFAFTQHNKAGPIVRKITDYPSHADARAQLGRCVNHPMRVSYLELAMDVWGPKEQALRFIADMLINHAAIMSHTPVRAVSLRSRTASGRPLPEVDFLSTAEGVIASLQAGATICIGNQRPDKRYGNEVSPFSLRLYWKCTDGQKRGLAKPLPAHEHRARFEVCIQDEALAEIGLDQVKNWAGWEAWQPTAATKFFAQRLPLAQHLPGGQRTILCGAARQPMTAAEVNSYRDWMRKKTGRDTKPRKHLTPADAWLNTRFRNALKRLGRELHAVSKG
jgi:prophage regulatory protein